MDNNKNIYEVALNATKAVLNHAVTQTEINIKIFETIISKIFNNALEKLCRWSEFWVPNNKYFVCKSSSDTDVLGQTKNNETDDASLLVIDNSNDQTTACVDNKISEALILGNMISDSNADDEDMCIMQQSDNSSNAKAEEKEVESKSASLEHKVDEHIVDNTHKSDNSSNAKAEEKEVESKSALLEIKSDPHVSDHSHKYDDMGIHTNKVTNMESNANDRVIDISHDILANKILLDAHNPNEHAVIVSVSNNTNHNSSAHFAEHINEQYSQWLAKHSVVSHSDHINITHHLE